MSGPERALIVRKPWAALLAEGAKVWELRSRRCCFRERVAIAEAAHDRLLGEATILDCRLVAERDAGGAWVAVAGREADFPGLPQNVAKHRAPRWWDLPYQRLYAWVFEDAATYSEPKPFVFPRGAQQWMRLTEQEPAASAGRALKRPAAA